MNYYDIERNFYFRTTSTHMGFLALQLLRTAADLARLLSPALFVQSGRNGLAELLGHALPILILLAALAGAAQTIHQTPLKRFGRNNLAELLGHALAMVSVICVWSSIHDAMPTEHANLIEDIVDVAMIHGAEATRALRMQTEALRQLSAVDAGSGGSGFARAKHIALEVLMHFLAGVVDGALAGMRKRPRW